VPLIRLTLILVLALALSGCAEEHSAPGAHEAEAGPGEEHVSHWRAFVVQALGLVVLVAILVKLAGPGIKKSLQDRSDKFASAYDKVRKETAEISRLVRELNDKLANLERDSKARLEKAIMEATSLKAEMVAEGKTQAEELASKASREVTLEEGIAIAEVKLEVVERAVAAARAALARGVSADVQRSLVGAAIDELGSLPEAALR